MSDEASKPIGKRIYAATVAQHDTDKYRNSLCANWLMANGKTSADCPQFTPTSMLNSKSHAQRGRGKRPTSEPNYEDHLERKRALEHYERSRQSPPDLFGDVIDAPDEFKFTPKYQSTKKENRALTPFSPVKEFYEQEYDFKVPKVPATGVKKRQDRKRIHAVTVGEYDTDKYRNISGPDMLNQSDGFDVFFDDHPTDGHAKKVKTYDEFNFDHNDLTMERSGGTRQSDAMVACNDHFDFTEFGGDGDKAILTSRHEKQVKLFEQFEYGQRQLTPFQPAKKHREVTHRQANTFFDFDGFTLVAGSSSRDITKVHHTKKSDAILLPDCSAPANPIIFNIKCENLVIANDDNYKKFLRK